MLTSFDCTCIKILSTAHARLIAVGLEDFSLLADFFKKSNEEDFEINLRADLSEYIGHEQIMTFNFENQEVLAKFPSTVKIDLSKNTKLFFDLTQISLFDAKTEERI